MPGRDIFKRAKKAQIEKLVEKTEGWDAGMGMGPLLELCLVLLELCLVWGEFFLIFWSFNH